jgi:hypothetical protein
MPNFNSKSYNFQHGNYTRIYSFSSRHTKSKRDPHTIAVWFFLLVLTVAEVIYVNEVFAASIVSAGGKSHSNL